MEDKEIVDIVFKKICEKLEVKLEFKDNQIEDFFAKKFKKGKASKSIYCLVGSPGKVHNIVTHI